LNHRLRDAEGRVSDDNQYLASDRDIRELMGARQLYIADVMDVDQNGETRKPFGRVFYTKNKRLIFYAFDLDRQAKVKEASSFQAWAREGSDDATPVSLGIFYVDSEANRRWVLKTDDPKVLAQINSVFVTMEPKGGSQKPSGKQLLYAYLRSASPNHP
jgi:Anti-sigma-K factor rskA